MKKILLSSFVFLSSIIYCSAQVDNKKEKDLLQGAWFGEEYDEHAVFEIDGDSILYIEHFDKFQYKVSKDTFDINTTTPHYRQLIIKLTPDSLILRQLPGMEIAKYWRD